jgi:hypothetical protein
MNNGVETNNRNRDWLNSYKNSDNSWVLYSRKQNITCYSGRVLFPYGPECADQELSKDLTRSQKIPLGFNLTFMGHQFNHAFVNQHGIISFQETFLGQTISQEDWPHPKYPYVDDPVFIAPFFAQTDLAGDKIDDLTSTKYGRVLYKVLHRVDLQPIYTEEEKFIYQMSMQILEDAQVLMLFLNAKTYDYFYFFYFLRVTFEKQYQELKIFVLNMQLLLLGKVWLFLVTA